MMAAGTKNLIIRMAACVLLLVAMCALAVPSAAFADDDSQVEIGEISSRYQALDSLSETADESDSVVVATRIGVLTAVNRALAGSTVSFSGEVVGDIMNADADHKWINVLGSDGSCIGVLVTTDMANRIKNLGDYDTTGSTVQVRGIYSVDCSDHQGELDVHAIDIRILDGGGKITHYVSEADITLGMQLCGIGLILLIGFFLLRRWYDKREDKEDEE